MSLQGPPFQAFPGHHTGVPLLQLNLRTSTVGGGGGEPESRHRVDGKLQVAAPRSEGKEGHPLTNSVKPLPRSTQFVSGEYWILRSHFAGWETEA